MQQGLQTPAQNNNGYGVYYYKGTSRSGDIKNPTNWSATVPNPFLPKSFVSICRVGLWRSTRCWSRKISRKDLLALFLWTMGSCTRSEHYNPQRCWKLWF